MKHSNIHSGREAVVGMTGAMTPLAVIIVRMMLLSGCDFPRPANVGGDAAGDDAGQTSNACCVTAEECSRIGSSAPKPCQLGVCVHNECTSVVGSCDGDEDC